MNNASTPETDAQYKEYARRDDKVKCVDINFARKLERERDEARRWINNHWDKNKQQWLNSVTLVCADFANVEAYVKQLESERDQLRKVCDELAKQYRHEMMSMFGHASDCDCSQCEPMVKLYNSLPHVIVKKGNNAV